jgi:NDP-sugar pyrophosphorylase family protein
VCESLPADGASERSIALSPQASVSGSAVLDGRCIIEDGVLIEDGAVVHDSVLLSGATIRGGAIISQSIIGPLAEITARREVIRTIVPGSPLRLAAPAAAPSVKRTEVAGA